MRRLWLLLLSGGLGLLVMACSTAAVQPTNSPTSAPTPGPTPTPLRAPRNFYIPTEFDMIYYPTDLNLIGATGRPQFINAYADWCRECQRNRPTVHQLQEQFGDPVDFLHVDVENPGAREAIAAVGMTGQTQYVLLDGAGDVVYRWYGIIDLSQSEAIFAELLSTADASTP
jgi:thiol-disulfide isomerase/thioredoxin